MQSVTVITSQDKKAIAANNAAIEQFHNKVLRTIGINTPNACDMVLTADTSLLIGLYEKVTSRINLEAMKQRDKVLNRKYQFVADVLISRANYLYAETMSQ